MSKPGSNESSAAARRAALYGKVSADIMKQDPIAAASGESMRLTTVPLSQMSFVPQSSASGVVTLEAVVVGEQSTRTNLVPATGSSITTATVLVVPLSDVPMPPARYDADGNQIPFPASVVINENRVTINTQDMVRFDEKDPHVLHVFGSGKDPNHKPSPAAAAGAARQPIPRVTYRDRSVAIARGMPITFETDKFAQLSGETKAFMPGDLIVFRGVSYDIEHAKDGRVFDKIKCTGVQRLGSWHEIGARHNEIMAVLFGELPQRLPNLPVLVRRTDWNPEAARARQREQKAKEDAEQYGLAYVPPAAAGGGASVPERQPDRKEQRKLTEESLTEQSRRALNTATLLIPLLPPATQIKDYLAAHGLPHKVWMLPGMVATRSPTPFLDYVLDVTEVTQQQQASAAGDTMRRDMSFGDLGPSVDGKQRKYVPKFNYAMELFQSLPSEPLEGERVDPATGAPVRPEMVAKTGMQLVQIFATNNAQQLTAYGIAEPLSLGYVGPVLYSKCPALNQCYVGDKQKTLESVNQNMPASPMTYYLSGVVQVTDYTGKEGKKKPATAFHVDHAAGIVSAGYPITPEAALKLIDIKGNQVGKTKVSTNMADSKVKNEYIKFNPLGAVKGGDVQNLFETQINYSAEKNDFQAFVVSNRAFKDFAMYPELEALTGAFASYADACALFGKLFVDMATGKFPAGMSGKERAADPAAAAEVDAVLAAYAAELAKAGNLKKFPFDPARLPSVFGPLCETDASSEAPTKSPFVYVPFAIRKEYLQLRQMDKYVHPLFITLSIVLTPAHRYLGDYFYLDVLFPLATQRHAAAIEAIEKGEAPAYSAWIKQQHAKPAAAAAAAGQAHAPPASPKPAAKPAAAKPPAKTNAAAPAAQTAPDAKRAKPAAKPAPAPVVDAAMLESDI